MDRGPFKLPLRGNQINAAKCEKEWRSDFQNQRSNSVSVHVPQMLIRLCHYLLYFVFIPLCSYLWPRTARLDKGGLFPAIRGQAGTGSRHISLIIVGKLTSSNKEIQRMTTKTTKLLRGDTQQPQRCGKWLRRGTEELQKYKKDHTMSIKRHNDTWVSGWRRFNSINSSIYWYYSIIEYLKLHSCHLCIK